MSLRIGTTRFSGARYLSYLLFIAGLGGLLYGIDVGIIAGALPYLESTASTLWHLSAQQLSFVVAAVLLGSVLSSLFAGALAEWLGRKSTMVLAGLLFALSIPIIATADGYMPLLLGRILQGVSGGLIGVVVPLYLAECLDAEHRGRGTALFQLMLTVGLVAAAVCGLYFARQIDAVAVSQVPTALFAAKDHAWRSIFWMCLIPGLVFTAGSVLLAESPRWLLGRGRRGAAWQALLRSRTVEQADAELAAMERSLAGRFDAAQDLAQAGDRLLHRRFVEPFLLACLILACTQATGINSILAYAVNILGQAGLPGSMGNLGDVGIKLLNALMTIVAVFLVDRKGRKFLLALGTAGIVVSLVAAGLLFQTAEDGRHDVRAAVAAQVKGDTLNLAVNADTLGTLGVSDSRPQQLIVSYAYGDFTNVQVRRSGEGAPMPIAVSRMSTVQSDSVIGAFFRRLHLNPFADPASASTAPLRIERATIGPVPGEAHGLAVAACVLAFIAFYALGPGVCVWLALSELMPTRIRSNGMSIALLINQFVSTVIAAVFLPTVGNHGYASMFYFWAGCTVVYLLTVVWWLPETKGKTLEEIEANFCHRGRERESEVMGVTAAGWN